MGGKLFPNAFDSIFLINLSFSLFFLFFFFYIMDNVSSFISLLCGAGVTNSDYLIFYLLYVQKYATVNEENKSSVTSVNDLWICS